MDKFSLIYTGGLVVNLVQVVKCLNWSRLLGLGYLMIKHNKAILRRSVLIQIDSKIDFLQTMAPQLCHSVLAQTIGRHYVYEQQ